MFATVETAGTWFAVGMATVSMVGTAWNSYLAYRSKGDALKYDAEKNEIRIELNHSKEERHKCEELNKELTRKVDECQSEHLRAKEQLCSIMDRLGKLEGVTKVIVPTLEK